MGLGSRQPGPAEPDAPIECGPLDLKAAVHTKTLRLGRLFLAQLLAALCLLAPRLLL